MVYRSIIPIWSEVPTDGRELFRVDDISRYKLLISSEYIISDDGNPIMIDSSEIDIVAGTSININKYNNYGNGYSLFLGIHDTINHAKNRVDTVIEIDAFRDDIVQFVRNSDYVSIFVPFINERGCSTREHTIVDMIENTDRLTMRGVMYVGKSYPVSWNPVKSPQLGGYKLMNGSKQLYKGTDTNTTLQFDTPGRYLLRFYTYNNRNIDCHDFDIINYDVIVLPVPDSIEKFTRNIFGMNVSINEQYVDYNYFMNIDGIIKEDNEFINSQNVIKLYQNKVTFSSDGSYKVTRGSELYQFKYGGNDMTSFDGKKIELNTNHEFIFDAHKKLSNEWKFIQPDYSIDSNKTPMAQFFMVEFEMTCSPSGETASEFLVIPLDTLPRPVYDKQQRMLEVGKRPSIKVSNDNKLSYESYIQYNNTGTYYGSGSLNTNNRKNFYKYKSYKITKSNVSPGTGSVSLRPPIRPVPNVQGYGIVRGKQYNSSASSYYAYSDKIPIKPLNVEPTEISGDITVNFQIV